MDIESYLDEIEAVLADARPLPLTTSVIVNRNELEDLAGELRAALPAELREARWVLRERDEVLAAAQREADQIRADALADAQRQASATEVARLARREAERITAEARDRARTLKLEAEDYVDARLAGFEQLLGKTLDAVVKGRERFRAGADEIDLDGDQAPTRAQLFDQERADRH